MQAGKTKMTKRLGVAVIAAAAALTLTACGSSSDTATSSTASAAATSAAATSKASSAASGTAAPGSAQASLAPVPEGDTVAVTLITKDSVNPFFVAMQEGAKAAAEKDNVTLTVAAGKEDGDEDGQVQAIENAISRGDKGILITPNGPGVNPAITKAREAGLFVIALDTPPDPADTVDITFATDNFKAGELIGKWTAAQLGGKEATIAMLDLFNDKIVSVDYNRDQGFLTGMGIDTARTRRRTATRRLPAPIQVGTTPSSVTNRLRATRTAARPPWKAACPRTRTSTWSTRSTNPPPPVPPRRWRLPGTAAH